VPAGAKTTTTDAARAIAWRHATHAAVCDVVERWEHGTVVRCTPLPDFHVYNAVRVEGAVPGLGVNTIAHAADVLLGGLGHRQVEVEDEVAGARLRPDFEALGWTTERLVWLSRTGPAPRGPEFEEVSFPATRALRLEWSLTFPWIGGKEAAEHFALVEDRAAAVRGSRALLSRDESGAEIGFVIFASNGGTAEIDQVYVTPPRRGRGIGGALVQAAVRVGGAAETFIVADDEGDPKRLYRRLGFEPVWRQHMFTRRPG
jgi:GNAT superfamily N-acetyltransferase